MVDNKADASQKAAETTQVELNVLSANDDLLEDDSYKVYENQFNEYLADGTVIKNIALTGQYGSGKSSILKTYFKNNHQSDVLWASLGTFRKNSSSDSAEDTTSSDEILTDLINQIIFQVPVNRVPLTRFKLKKKLDFSLILSVSVLLLDLFGNSLGISSVVHAKNISYMIPWVTLFAISYILYFVSQKMFLQKIKLPFLTGSADIDLTQEKSFDKNIDEIVYLFQKSGKRILVIEDLDRFGNVDVFEKMRELNTKLNYAETTRVANSYLGAHEWNSEPINSKNWTFIYAIKDEIFINPTDRTKFFDLILPVIPFVTRTNAAKRFRELIPYDAPAPVGAELLKIIGKYIYDNRLVTNVVNEYKLMIKIMYGRDDISEKQSEELFALIAIKNFNVTAYNSIQNEQLDLLASRRISRPNSNDEVWNMIDEIVGHGVITPNYLDAINLLHGDVSMTALIEDLDKNDKEIGEDNSFNRSQLVDLYDAVTNEMFKTKKLLNIDLFIFLFSQFCEERNSSFNSVIDFSSNPFKSDVELRFENMLTTAIETETFLERVFVVMINRGTEFVLDLLEIVEDKFPNYQFDLGTMPFELINTIIAEEHRYRKDSSINQEVMTKYYINALNQMEKNSTEEAIKKIIADAEIPNQIRLELINQSNIKGNNWYSINNLKDVLDKGLWNDLIIKKIIPWDHENFRQYQNWSDIEALENLEHSINGK